MLHQNDAVGLVLFDSEVRQYLPPKARKTQFRRILDLLDHSYSKEDTDVGAVLHDMAERIPRRGLVILLSDLIDDEAKIADGLQHFRHNSHEVIVFHVMDDAELTFPYDRLTRFKDMEGVGRVTANPKSLRNRYLARIQPVPRHDQAGVLRAQRQLQPGQHQGTLRPLPGGVPGEAARLG